MLGSAHGCEVRAVVCASLAAFERITFQSSFPRPAAAGLFAPLDGHGATRGSP
jgi:hypothetical protein